ncbi:hypothetical protein AB0M11_13515 [Streptomyces sp. NPDC051987]|uniref:hypothetical protein n=1 Tax=Streptomyces sp. NPDC051987 TaxID=3155808 RepID=UPI003449328E
MTEATCRRLSRPRGSATRWTWAAVVALLAALAVLLHHDTAAPAGPVAPVTAMGGMPGMTHTTAPATGRTGPAEAAPSSATAPTPAPGQDHDDDDGGPCSGPAMQHCSAGDVSGPQLLAPPSAVRHAVQGFLAQRVPAGHVPSGIPHRAPPDLSLLSRLLI